MMTEMDLLLLEIQNDQRVERREYDQKSSLSRQANWTVYDGLRSLDLWPSHMNDRHFVKMIVRAAWSVQVTAEDLPRLRTVFPQVKDTKNYEVENVAKNLVKVFLDLGVSGAAIRVYYVKQLEPDSRCKIVRALIEDDKVVCSI